MNDTYGNVDFLIRFILFLVISDERLCVDVDFELGQDEFAHFEILDASFVRFSIHLDFPHSLR